MMENKSAKPAYYAVIPAAIRYDATLRPSAKLLYGELTALSSASGYCWASNQYFAELYGVTVKTVSELISSLESRGYIRCEMATTSTGRERRIFAGSFFVSEETGRGINKNVNTPPEKCEEGSSQKCKEPPSDTIFKNNTRLIRGISRPLIDRVIAYANNNAELLHALNDFAELRTKQKKPLVTDRQLTLLINKLDKISKGDVDVKIAMLNKAILHGWDSVYELKPDEMPRCSSAPEKGALPEW